MWESGTGEIVSWLRVQFVQVWGSAFRCQHPHQHTSYPVHACNVSTEATETAGSHWGLLTAIQLSWGGKKRGSKLQVRWDSSSKNRQRVREEDTLSTSDISEHTHAHTQPHMYPPHIQKYSELKDDLLIRQKEATGKAIPLFSHTNIHRPAFWDSVDGWVCGNSVKFWIQIKGPMIS